MKSDSDAEDVATTDNTAAARVGLEQMSAPKRRRCRVV